MKSDLQPDATRRTLLWGICGATCAGTLTACGSGAESASPQASPALSSSPTPTAAPLAPPSTTAPVLAATSDIPVGGGRVFPDFRLVVTQPTAGDLKAFTAICTHDGCLLNGVANATINCPCHGSRFAITDGAVVHGPAMRALTPRTIAFQGDSIVLNP